MMLVDPALSPECRVDRTADPAFPEASPTKVGSGRVDEPSGTRHVFLYGARCPTLRQWSTELGFEVLQVGVSDDPLRCVATLAEHGSKSYFARPYDEDGGVCSWEIVPLDACGNGMPMPAGCEAWAGTIRAELPPGATLAEMAERLALFLSPLEALTSAQVPSALEGRFVAGKLLPVMPRYTVASDATRLVRDLYRVHDAEDHAYLVAALDAALRTLGPGRVAFDDALATLAHAPRSGELMRAGRPAPA